VDTDEIHTENIWTALFYDINLKIYSRVICNFELIQNKRLIRKERAQQVKGRVAWIRIMK
jgi:hypothetical protein